MSLPFATTSRADDIAIIPLRSSEYEPWLESQPAAITNWLRAHHFIAKEGITIALPAHDGTIGNILAIIPIETTVWDWASIASQLPSEYHYYIDEDSLPDDPQDVLLGWALESYRYTTYKSNEKSPAILRIPEQSAQSPSATFAENCAESIFLVRELINRPANDLTPAALAKACHQLAEECGAGITEITGDALLEHNYPTIHAVGRACKVEPRLLDIRWGDAQHPSVTIVGKGVCFDTGGLNIKGGKSMGMMKKDMGGAAASLGLARLIMKQNLPICLRVLIPAVENSIAGNAFRPQDILRTRKGLTVEIGNTDAEGRLILCDALADADDEMPDLLIDMATLTGASRVALGPDIPSFFTNDTDLAHALESHSRTVHDPLWRLPLWDDYSRYIESDVADLDNSGSGGGYAGAITAGLFLQRFVTQTKRWLHIDMMAWNVSSRPGRPKGGEAQGIRALFDYLAKTYTR